MRAKELIIYHLNYVWRLIVGRRKKDFSHYQAPFNTTPQTTTLFLMNPRFMVHNNMWGVFKLEKTNRVDEYIQGINANQWIFKTPNKNHGVIGYPNILILDHVGTVEQSLEKNYVVKYDYTLDLEKYKKYNLAFDMWLQFTQTWELKRTVNEIMIWEDYFVAKPAGRKIGQVYHDGSWYSIFHGWIDKSKEPNSQINGWYLTTFVREKRRTKGSISISFFMNELRNRELVGSKLFLNQIELGTEVYNATGVVTVNELELKIFE